MMLIGGKKVPSIIVSRLLDGATKNEESYKKMASEPEQAQGGGDLQFIADGIMRAIKESDVLGLSEKLKAFFQVCDEMPHEESGGPTEGPEDKYTFGG